MPQSKLALRQGEISGILTLWETPQVAARGQRLAAREQYEYELAIASGSKEAHGVVRLGEFAFGGAMTQAMVNEPTQLKIADQQSNAFSAAREENAFLTGLSESDLEVLRPHLRLIKLVAGDYVYHAGKSVGEVTFPRSGLVIMRMPTVEQVGAGMVLIGRDGIVGGFLSAAAAPATCDAIVLVSGEGWRMAASTFRHLLEANSSLRNLAGRFHAAMMAHVQQTASCAINHSVEKRVSRWVLQMADRTGSTDVRVLQSDLATMLGVQRTTVNFALGQLERAGAIVSVRGHIKIVDREKLKSSTCECYGRLKSYVDALFHPAARIDVLTA